MNSVNQNMYIPTATYRVQLHKDFNFGKLKAIIGYLAKLGISTIYASPITRAVEGSMHGYDNLDPLVLNPEIGTMEEWEEIHTLLRKYNMGWIQDIVPNHMAFTPANRWIFDLLEKGKQSRFYHFFDIISQGTDDQKEERIMLPFLGKSLRECVISKEILLEFTKEGFYFKYFDELYPVSVESYAWISNVALTEGQVSYDWKRKAGALFIAKSEDWLAEKKKLFDEAHANIEVRLQVENAVFSINSSHELLLELLDCQHYQLCEWKRSRQEMNFRRFFAVNALICLRMENQEVFDTWHPFLISLYEKRFIQGFRLDHIDGLFDPGAYLKTLRQATGKEAYIVSEKILHEHEETITSWPVQGTTGYDFLSFTNQLLTDHAGKKELEKFYRNQIKLAPYEDLVFDKKYSFLKTEMNGELTNLMRWLAPWLEINNIKYPDGLKEALAIFLCAFPVYRAYAESLPMNEMDMKLVAKAFGYVRHRFPEQKINFDIIEKVFETEPEDPAFRQALYFIRRWSQYTAPLAAKGIEDTMFYNYNALISHNEVGDSPDHTAVTATSFHSLMSNRALTAIHSMNASSTHDTKRGEENRLRISLICRHSSAWTQLVPKIKQASQQFVRNINGTRIPSVNDEYMIYQALVGAIPVDMQMDESFYERFKAYLSKAQREEKAETTWSEPNEEYEEGCFNFTQQILENKEFNSLFLPFLQLITDDMYVYSLSQTLIKCTAPGIPDIYQGAELWDLSLVDPDNRLPVDYQKRIQLLGELEIQEKEGKRSHLKYAETNRIYGAQKILLIQKILHFRKQHPLLFSEGEYVPVVDSENIIAYLRRRNGEQILVVVPLPVDAEKSKLQTKTGLTGTWTELITGTTVRLDASSEIKMLLKDFPVGAWISGIASHN